MTKSERIVTIGNSRYRIGVSTSETVVNNPSMIVLGKKSIPVVPLIPIIVAIILIVIFVLKVLSTPQEHKELKISEDTTEVSSPYTPEVSSVALEESTILKNGFVFDDSSSRYLTEEDISHLIEYKEVTLNKLLRLAINELYARHGYEFNNGEYANYYKSLGCSCDVDMETARNRFNEIELYNLNYLVSIEKEKGYRD